ncbi:uncharacterized protein PHACADRAFT_31267 [Phanerochaete carnosa HHB-10118-sp]|uniref:C2H2-type domain-containing protein n=1 Tax=Phanerochaete carnosa (strain HHB-10118-sp) TaxID=650164 RepID=K5W1T4_PHACS|nr:uncharacterized protein PHACADRAFT_31267 [Phanerochaete carnosa HHB-10118-sp]EKM52829.1 hypothetical protein PHACADRAFT_31267 [Phanerochaete carnosa HHB-10118-sp]
MTTLFASRHHFPMDPSPFNPHALPPSAASSHSSLSSPRMFSADGPATGIPEHRSTPYGSPFVKHENNARPRTQSPLQISTSAASAHETDPEEETAHPSRMRTQLQHGKGSASGATVTAAAAAAAAAVADGGAQASTSSSRRSPSPSRTLARPPSVSLTASHGFGNLDDGLSRPLTHKERELLAHLDRLKFFLATAPSRWTDAADVNPADPSSLPVGHPNSAHPALNRFLLPNSEYVSCVLWGGLYHITGTDIVRALVFRFEAFGRPVRNMKKFEEGVFSDLRNLKPGVDACLEEPKSPFLDLLFKYQCIRTQKKQKVFYWFSVPHDRLFLDALERDLKREKMGLEPTTGITGEPALSFSYDPKRSLYEQFSKASGVAEGEGELEAAVRRADQAKGGDDGGRDNGASSSASERHQSDADMSSSEADEPGKSSDEKRSSKSKSALHGPNSPFFSMFSLFEGSPTYKQRRKKVPKHRSPSLLGISPYMSDHADDYFGVPASAPAAHGMNAMRPPEPQMDRYGRDTARLSAAEMFLAQARGDFGPQSNPDLIASQKERQRRAMLARAGQLADKGYFAPGMPGADGGMHQQALRASPESIYGSLPVDHDMGRPHAEQRHTFPLPPFPIQDRVRAHTQPYGGEVSSAWQQPASDPIAIQRTKAFVCPLFSCGRMFKRMEHLKRHLRTHTLERPYQCQRCKKRFSRSDNLNQHLRTHTRGDGAERGEGEGEGEGEADIESEDVDELDDEAGIEGYINALGTMPDVQMCEVEIQGQVHEVHGDEDGLVVPAPGLTPSGSTSTSVDEAQELYYSDAGLVDSEQSPFVTGSPGGSQWAAIRSSHPSPAFSTVSMPSPSLSSSYGSSYSVTDYISMSAPSHKQSFDHAALYPTGAELNGPGPIRRHRSATPSVSRYSEGARRPYTASESSRSFHPYALPAHSADSSPMAYNVPLAYDDSPQMAALSRPPTHHQHHHHHHHSHSRSSSTGQLQEQLDQMLNLEPIDGAAAAAAGLAGSFHEPPPMAGGPAVGGAYGELYRTDSPMQFAGAPAGPYDVDVDVHSQSVFPMSLDNDVAPFPLQHSGGFYNDLAPHGSVPM